MNTLTLDFETYYAQDFTLSNLTNEEYVRDPRFQALCLGWKEFGGHGCVERQPAIEGWLAAVDWSNTAVILQHAPSRRKLGDFADVPTPDPLSEINLIETFADTRVIGLTINHENMSDAEVTAAITMYELELGIPATDALTRPTDRLVEMVVDAFPELVRKPVASAT